MKNTQMTVIEAIRKYGLEKCIKHYKDQYGNTHDTDIPLNELAKMEVKAVTIYPFYDEAEITIIKF